MELFLSLPLNSYKEKWLANVSEVVILPFLLKMFRKVIIIGFKSLNFVKSFIIDL